VIVASVNTAPFGVRTFEITFVPFLRVGSVMDKFLSLFTTSEVFFAGDVYVVRFAFEVVVAKKLFML
jgi:hypothetical protein